MILDTTCPFNIGSNCSLVKLSNDSPSRNSSKALLSGAKTVKGPSPSKVSKSSAFFKAASKDVKSGEESTSVAILTG